MKKNIVIGFTLILVGAGILIVNFFGNSGEGNLKIQVEKAPYIMPAAHQVYANEEALNGKYFLFKVLLTNEGNNTLESVKVRYRVPGYVDWTDLETIGEMIPGQTASVVCYPKFGDQITEKMTESMERAEIQVDWDGASNKDKVEESFAFKIVDRNTYMFTSVAQSEIASWADIYDNNALLACFVTPNDPIVKYYTQTVQEKILKGDAAGVSKDPKDAVRFMTGIYEATLMSHMVYSSTKMIPENLNDYSKLSQHNRLPREVITGNTGLCLELSLLYASMMSAGGLEPVIYLVPGHAYPGFRMNGQYYAIEATGIGGEGLGKISSAQEALEQGMKQLEEFFQKAMQGDPRYTIVDIHQLNMAGVTPMSLKDDEFMRQKVDKIADNFSPQNQINAPQAPQQRQLAAVNTNNTTPPNYPTEPAQPDRNTTTSTSLMVSIPNGWNQYDPSMSGLSSLRSYHASPDGLISISKFVLPASNLRDAMNILSAQIGSLGGVVNYKSDTQGQISGVTTDMNGNFMWFAKSRRTSAGFEIITVGSPEYAFAQQQNMLTSIFNSIR
ncbi:hypothetical protein [Mongoliitalea daihaiensis]|uniref:hypothetical protein n=1 Tax=Mongoliitalea daihaiensis TaxID=2782006 RepID=UPI001F1F29B0|nr:hypothetical protein [Mongoliitalea daihaiensis]UJP65916.1 hypothetical protein IPZ59_04645 [Mongoliitalea daihaiensis]